MLTWQTVDRSKWEYKDVDASEPDKAQWAAHGLDCLIVRGPSGALCGYVGVPESHPCFGVGYENVDVEVHGGLTFADRCQPTDDPAKHICHMEEFSVNKTVWWLGFDCAHAWDICPAYQRAEFLFSFMEETYKSFPYVQQQVEKLAAQLAEIK